MLPLPKAIDVNEWIIVAACLLGWGAALLLPRRFPFVLTVLLFVFTLTIANELDHVLAAPPFDYFNLNDHEKYELFDAIFYFVLYPPIGYIFVYLYDRWNLKGIYVLLYMLLWSLAGISIEWAGLHLQIFYYTKWNIASSFPVYLVIQCLTLAFFHFICLYGRKTGLWRDCRTGVS
ncbi:hypothetical protein [Brevibacillus migulae]|uniref:hypothetical protein n=1 Tax=Brevibacillus migulae TaxID=1644114 RepID=UPI00106EE34B|nr:hypothetical protein [Brevibacillus migulae]